MHEGQQSGLLLRQTGDLLELLNGEGRHLLASRSQVARNVLKRFPLPVRRRGKNNQHTSLRQPVCNALSIRAHRLVASIARAPDLIYRYNVALDILSVLQISAMELLLSL
jgi:hypothetical protein